MAEPLLHELCRICHIHPPKYRCPRCSAQTCSLPCTKRHKLWAQCSGIRDPAAYVKRSDLATPAGIDRDYNFLTGIERQIDGAEKDAERRGVQLAGDGGNGEAYRGRRAGPRKGEVNVLAAIRRTGVIVDRAPKGMVRSRENKTHWHKKHKCLSWTVEWVHDNGTKELGNALETLPLTDAYAKHLAEKRPPARKRKLDVDQTPASPAATVDAPSKPQLSEAPAADQQPPATRPAAADDAASIESRPSHAPEDDQEAPPSPTPVRISPIDSAPPPTTNPLLPEPPSTQPCPPLHFYLLRPHTPSASPVLIPLSSSAPLSQSLSHHVILEFPTIYVLPHAPSSLPDGYTLESVFLGQSRREEDEVRELLSVVPHVRAEYEDYGMTETARQQTVDDRKILDVLRKDLGGTVRLDGGI
ncbi:hypothetical protein MMC16_002774 [Acarospora aff. strigata]|nr:hypothetical protein [Acarospora aff. strigata]